MMREEPKTAVSFRRNREDNDCMCPVIYDQNKALLLTELVEQYEPTMLRIAQRYGVSTESAGDVVQETWLAMLRGWQKFEGRSSLKTWLFAILTKRSATQSKRARRFISLDALMEANEECEPFAIFAGKYLVSEFQAIEYGPSQAEPPEETLLRNELRQWIDQAIMSLPHNLRQVMTLRDVEGWTAEETCALLKLSNVNQRVLLHRARSRVRQILEVLLLEGI